ncbi:MAG TPA: response regulator [Polyangiales bacterium]|jgi:DNA-binding NtrC family response regulator|nr:response regulator [Polyangiales bacterium]
MDDSPATAPQRALSACRSAPLLVLAEDDDEFRALLARTLRRAGYDVAELNNGVQLLRTLVSHQLDGASSEIAMIISDIRMPGASGMDALEGINWTSWPIPVVLMTGFGDRETHQKAAKLGAAAVIDKPFDLDELLALVTKLLHKARPACAT